MVQLLMLSPAEIRILCQILRGNGYYVEDTKKSSWKGHGNTPLESNLQYDYILELNSSLS